MNRNYTLIFETLKCALFGKQIHIDSYKMLSSSLWQQLFDISARQGVLAITHEVVASLPKEVQPPRMIRLQWALSTESIEKRYNRQLKTAQIVSSHLKANNILCPILKGLAISKYYPYPSHRECGDIDLYSGKLYEQVNVLMEQFGASVKRDYYVHSHIYLNGVVIENHQYCIGIRGSQDKKMFAKYLDGIIYKDLALSSSSDIISPSADFNALFLTMHGLNHFLSEGIKLRHILDWALLLKAEQNNINWAEFYHWADKLHMARFADALTAISVKHFGLEISNPAIHTTSPYADRILEDTLFKSEGLYNKGYSAWKGRIMLIRNKFSFGWKYHKIYQKSVIFELMRSAFAFLFEKNPKL